MAVVGNVYGKAEVDDSDLEEEREMRRGTAGGRLHQAADMPAILQCNDPTLPPEIRLGFIKKTYGLVLYMITITFAIASPFIFATESTTAFLEAHAWIGQAVSLSFSLLYAMNFVLCFAIMCNCNGLLKSYLGMFQKTPHNVLFLTLVSATFGVLVGWICSLYTVTSVLWTFFASAVIIVGLTVYAVRTSADFTDMGGYVLCGLLGLLLCGVLSMFIPGMNGLYCGIGAMLFGFIIVYDTQLIFGKATPFPQSEEQRRTFEYTIDMYAFAAYQLYLDYVNLFLYLLRLVGERRE
jgi:FtsH-binding integral membrane protein